MLLYFLKAIVWFFLLVSVRSIGGKKVNKKFSMNIYLGNSFHDLVYMFVVSFIPIIRFLFLIIFFVAYFLVPKNIWEEVLNDEQNKKQEKINKDHKNEVKISKDNNYESFWENSFLSSFKNNKTIKYITEDENVQVKHAKWAEQLNNNALIIHESDILVDEDNNIIEKNN